MTEVDIKIDPIPDDAALPPVVIEVNEPDDTGDESEQEAPDAPDALGTDQVDSGLGAPDADTAPDGEVPSP